MSSMVFPSTLAGVDIKWTRTPLDATHIDEALSGKESRWTASTWPRYRYECDINILRADSLMAAAARNREWQQFCSHVGRHFGRLDSFLLIDPDDSSVTDVGFAVGDGVTAAFQLQRTLAGDVIDAAGVEYAAQTKPYKNLLFNSSFETDSNADGLADSWSVYNDSGGSPVFTTIIPGRLPNTKAQRISWGTATTGVKMGFTGSLPASTWVAGQWFTVSAFIRVRGATVGAPHLEWNTAPSTTVNVAVPTMSTSWQRYVWQVFWNVGATAEASANLFLSGIGGGSSGPADLDFDDVQVSTGQWTASDLLPISTPAAAIATLNPSYWPAYADGFEPITELNGDATIFEEGTWRGRRQLYPYTRSNLVGFSEQFDNAAWTKTNASISANSTTAPDGTATADTFNEGAAVTVLHFVEETIAAETTGELRCYSLFLKANTLPNVTLTTNANNTYLNFNLSTGVVFSQGSEVVASGVQTSPLWPGWYRIWLVHRATSLATSFRMLAQFDGSYSGAAYTGTSRTFFLWGAMAERTSNLNGPTPYIPTPSSAAVTVTDYTLASGVFTPVSVPASTVFYSWTGSYYRRARLDMDGVPTNRLAQAMYDAKSIQLVSVK